jgi:hypothetical protein
MPTRPTEHRTTPPWARGLGTLAALVLALPGTPTAHAQPGDQTRPPAPTQPDPGPLARLLAAEATPETRALAASELVRLPPESPDLSPAAALLVAPETPVEAARAILAAIAADAIPPARWMAPCIELATGDSPLGPDAIAALGSFRTREAASVLVEIVNDTRPTTHRDGAARALCRLSARDDIPQTGWRDWLNQSLALSERQWEQQLLLDHVRKTQAMAAAARDTDRRLAEAWRQIHLLTPPEQRSDILAQLLTSPIAGLRDLGFDLVNREIGESRPIGAPVSHAAIALIASPDPTVRAAAAALLDRLAPPEAEPTVLSALERETDPRAAEALLRAASRWPSPALVKPVLRWLDASPSLRQRAAAGAWALLRADLLPEPADRLAVLQSVRAIETASLSAPAARILATLGADQDLARLRSLLTAPDPAIRTMAADALALRPDQTDTLLAAANADATLFEPTARALRAHLHDARGYAALSRLPAPTPQVRARTLADYATLLPTPEIVRLAHLASDPAEAVHLLRPLTAPDRAIDPDAPDARAQAAQLAEGLLLLARTAVALDSPTDALNAVTLVPDPADFAPPQATPPPWPIDARSLNNLRATCLLWLNRPDQAAAVECDASAYLDAIEHAIDEPHAAIIADRLDARFDALDPDDRARLDGLLRRLAAAPEPEDPPGGG